MTGGPTSTVTYGYDADGNRDSLVYPNNDYSFAYTYTGRNQLKSVRNTTVSNPTATFGYNVNGSLIARSLGNGTSSSYGYDPLGRVESISHALSGETRTFGYDYDSVGRRKWAQRDNARGDVFGYDLNDEVTAAKLNITNPATTGAGTPTISYDANGNRATFAAAYGATDTYVTNNLSQYTSRNGVSATYGPKGNLGSFGAGTNYIYDAQNRLTSATDGGNTFTFKYDGLNRQVSRKLNAGAPVYCVWDGWELLEEVQNNSVTAAYLTGAKGLIKDLISNNYYYQDGSGSTSHLADNNGALLEWYRYDLQGTPIVSGPADVVRTGGSSYAIRHLFTGQQWIKELGLYDLRNRFYSPDLGRFLQPDPIGFSGDPSNLYRYCGGDPVNRADPTGLVDSDSIYWPEFTGTEIIVTGTPIGGGVDIGTGLVEGAHDWGPIEQVFWSLGGGDHMGGPVGDTGGRFGIRTGVTPHPFLSPPPIPQILDRRSEKNVVTLLPRVQALARDHVALAIAAGINVQIISGSRTIAEQNALFAQGRTTPGDIVTSLSGGQSNHNFGAAYDVGVFAGGMYISDGPQYDIIGRIGVDLGLSWGGNWTGFVDRPHFEYTPAMPGH